MQLHSFHIPVMGIGFTIDTPIKVAHLGISSAISLVDDILAERMREFYSSKYGLPFQSINTKIEDSRAKRITAYLNTVNTIVQEKYSAFKASLQHKREDLLNFASMLPGKSEVRDLLLNTTTSAETIEEILNKYIHPGSIDVNIMTKLDKENYINNEKLPSEHNDAHAALRGFAQSDLSSSIVLSAGMNPRLYSYIEKFDDFYPDQNYNFKKKITLKVSDYRSAIIQGKFLAKKGLWVSEFRVESGLNCGGHAFASQGFLMGPILEEFSNNREKLIKELFDIYAQALERKKLSVPPSAPEMLLTAQGGVGTYEEHSFLTKHYNLDSIGWGSPFLLVPEAVSIDQDTLHLLANGREEDFYLSNISPVGVRFNNIKNNSRDIQKQQKADAGKPGAACTKKFILLNKEFTERPICVASRQYQKTKINELEASGITGDSFVTALEKITEKACICNGLGVATLKSHGLDTSKEGDGVSVCPGPNLAYFDRECSLSEMIDHIYGRNNLITQQNRPNLFIKELDMYLDYIEEEMNEMEKPSIKQIKSWNEYLANLKDGINYYQELFANSINWSDKTRQNTLEALTKCLKRHSSLTIALEEVNQKALISR